MAEEQNSVILELQVQGERAIQSIQAYRREIEQLQAARKVLKAEVENGTKSEQQAEAEEIKLTAQIKERQAAVRALENQLKKQIAAERANGDSINDLKKQLASLTAAYDNLSASERQSAAGAELRDKINEVTNALKQGEEATQRYQRNVGNYENAIKSALSSNIPFVNSLTKMSSTVQALAGLFGKNTAAVSADAAATQAAATASAEAAAGLSAEAAAAGQATTASAAATGASVGLGAGLKVLTGGIQAVGRALLQLLANPIVAIIAAIAAAVLMIIGVVKKVIAVMKQNEEQAAALQQVLAPIRVLVDAVTRVLENLGKVVLAVVGAVAKAVTAFTDFVGITKDASKEAEEYARHEREVLQLTIDLRKAKEKESEIDLQNSELRAKVAEKDKYTATERIKMLEQVLANEKQVADEKKRLAEKNLQLLEEEASRTKNSTEMEDKLTDARIAVNNATKEYNETLRAANKQLSQFRQEEAEEAKKAAEERKKRYEQAVAARKEALQKEREAVRAAEDAILDLMKDTAAKGREAAKLQYERTVEDLRARLESEKTLTLAAREAIQRQIEVAEKKYRNTIAEIDRAASADRLKQSEDLIKRQLEIVAKGSEEELMLRYDLLNKQEQMELAAAENSEQQKMLIRQKYAKLRDEEQAAAVAAQIQKEQEAAKQVLEARFAEIENEYLKEVTAEQANAETRRQAEVDRRTAELAATVEQRRLEWETLQQLEGESIEAFNARKLEIENAYLNAQNEQRQYAAEQQVEIERTKTETLESFSNALVGALEAVGDGNKEAAMAAKVIALADVAIKSGQAIADVTAANAAGDPYTYAIRVATAIATVVTNMATAITNINKAKFATGGYVQGAGTATSDSIPAMLSNGESVINAKSTSMFGGLLSAINMAGGGVPISVADAGNTAIGEEMLARAVARGVAMMPAPVVSVEDINEGIRRVGVIDANATI